MGTVGDIADKSRIFKHHVAAAGGAIMALILTQVVYGKVDLTMVLNGALAGLVSITAEPLTHIGCCNDYRCRGGAIVVFSVPLLDKFKTDDVVGAIPVHLIAGIWGTLAVPLTNSDASFGTQIISIMIVGAFTVVASGVVWLVIKATLGIRVSEEDELAGLDTSELGMDAYPDFQNNKAILTNYWLSQCICGSFFITPFKRNMLYKNKFNYFTEFAFVLILSA